MRIRVGRRSHERAVQVDVDLTEQRMQPVIPRTHRIVRVDIDHLRFHDQCWRDSGNHLPFRVFRIRSVHPSRERPSVDILPIGCGRCWSESAARQRDRVRSSLLTRSSMQESHCRVPSYVSFLGTALTRRFAIVRFIRCRLGGHGRCRESATLHSASLNWSEEL